MPSAWQKEEIRRTAMPEARRFKAILNKWVGNDFENDTTCQICRRKGHVAIIPVPGIFEVQGRPQPFYVSICGTCLDEAILSIYAEILKSFPTWRDPRKVSSAPQPDEKKPEWTADTFARARLQLPDKEIPHD
jgi:hypothetical protein